VTAELFGDVRHSSRALRRSPGFTLTAIAAVALGIGASTAIFSVVNKVLLEPLPYPEPERLVQLMTVSQLGDQNVVSIPKFVVWRDMASSFRYVAAYDSGGPGVNLNLGGVPETIAAAHVSEDYFRIFGGDVLLGRTFSRDEDRPGGRRAAAISYNLWRRRFGGDPTVVGRSIPLGHESYTVIGVMASGFAMDPPADIWLALQADPNAADPLSRVRVVGRLMPGISLHEAQDDLDRTIPLFQRRYPWVPLLPLEHFTAIPLRDAVVGNVKPALYLLIGAVGFVLLISCANVANLLLARSTRRARELAIRTALGAQRKRLVRQLLTESLMLALAGGAAGLALGYLGVRALLAASPGDIPRIGANGSAITLDWRVFLFTLLVSLATGILFGLLPALTASRTDVGALVKDSPAQSGMGFRHNRGRAVLVVTEMALALVLLAGAGLLIRTFVAMRTVNRGFDEQNVLIMRMSLASPQFQKTSEVGQLVRATEHRMRNIPGVSVVATTSALPLEPSLTMPFAIHKYDQWLGRFDGAAGWRSVSPGYFDAFRIRLMRGRLFTDADDENNPPVALINRMMLKKFWPEIEANPIGEFITIGKFMGKAVEEAPRQIIGVVADVRDSAFTREPTIYVPAAQVSNGMNARNNAVLPITWVIRGSGGMPVASAAIQDELREVSGGMPMERAKSMHEVVAASSARAQFYMMLLTIFAGIALLLAAVGLYGVMSYSVQQRTQEIGIRMALGASGEDIRGMVLWQGARLALLGILVGIPTALAMTRVMVSMIFGITTWDPVVFITVTVLLSVVAVIATHLPSRRATGVDPATALRA